MEILLEIIASRGTNTVRMLDEDSVSEAWSLEDIWSLCVGTFRKSVRLFKGIWEFAVRTLQIVWFLWMIWHIYLVREVYSICQSCPTNLDVAGTLAQILGFFCISWPVDPKRHFGPEFPSTLKCMFDDRRFQVGSFHGVTVAWGESLRGLLDYSLKQSSMYVVTVIWGESLRGPTGLLPSA